MELGGAHLIIVRKLSQQVEKSMLFRSFWPPKLEHALF